MDIFHFNPGDLLSFYLTLFRISIILFMLPIFGGKSVPNPVKAALTLVLAMALWPHLSFPGETFPADPVGIGLMIFGELLLGLVLGMAINFTFAAVQTGGQLAGFGMGFTMVNVVDPVTGVSEAVTAHFLYMCTILVFLSLDGHLHLLGALASSFKIIPPGGLLLKPELSREIVHLSEALFVLAVRIASPIIAALFLVDLALALVAKAAPQMNLLAMGFPIKIGVGFIFLGLMFSIMSIYIQDYIVTMGPMFRNLMELGSP